MSDGERMPQPGVDVPDRRGRTGLDRVGRDLDRNPRVRVRDVRVLTSNWYVTRATTFDFQHADGTWTIEERETYDRGDGATILLYEPEARTVLLTRQFRFPVYVNEHPDGMLRHAPAKFRDRIWHIEIRPDGSEWLHFNGGTRPAGALALAGTAGMSAAERDQARAGKLRYTEVRPGAFEPAPRLPDMDVEGIVQSVLYPTMLLGLPSLQDAEFAEAQANAYNAWLAEYCSYAPTRLFGVAIVF